MKGLSGSWRQRDPPKQKVHSENSCYKNSIRFQQWASFPLSFLLQATPRPKNRYRSYIQRDFHSLSSPDQLWEKVPGHLFLFLLGARKEERKRAAIKAQRLTLPLVFLSLFSYPFSAPDRYPKTVCLLPRTVTSLGYGGLSPNGRRYESALISCRAEGL